MTLSHPFIETGKQSGHVYSCFPFCMESHELQTVWRMPGTVGSPMFSFWLLKVALPSVLGIVRGSMQSLGMVHFFPPPSAHLYKRCTITTALPCKPILAAESPTQEFDGTLTKEAQNQSARAEKSKRGSFGRLGPGLR